jgi:hypothetical protein
MSGNTNPGNFANRDPEEVKEIASKGGQASHSGGFASMDPDKQVSISSSPTVALPYRTNADVLKERDRLQGWPSLQRLLREGQRESS